MNRPVKIKPKKPSEPVNIEVEELAEPLTLSLEPYLSEEYARAEGDKLWAKVWQHAGRVEEIPEAGDYLTYDIGDDSILIVRSAPDTIRVIITSAPTAAAASWMAHRAATARAVAGTGSSAASMPGGTT